MPLSRSTARSTLAAAAAALALAAVAMPRQTLGQPGPFRTPQFKATAISFKALHETHANWMGSDEVYGGYYDFTSRLGGSTSKFGDVDAGETRAIAPDHSCISVQPTCDKGASSLAFGIYLMEDDDWGIATPGDFCHGSLSDPGTPPPTPEEFERTFDNFTGDGCSSDDFIGKAKIKLTQDELVAALPTVGASFDRTVRLTGGDGTYEFTYRVTRLPNAIDIPDIGPGVLVNAISLQVTVDPDQQKRAHLIWSGATTSDVDIYRDAAKVVTTTNDGDYVDTVESGTHQYSVCNLGSTTVCSAQVPAMVP